MKNNLLMMSLNLSLIVVLLIGCNRNHDINTSNNKSSPVTINMFTASPEYAEAVNEYIEEYRTIRPEVTINLEIMQNDYRETLRSRIMTGSTPDVFQSSAGGDIDLYAEYSADLTDQPLVAAMTDAVRWNMTSQDGKVLGVPIKSNLFALIYNRSLLELVGISSPPRTMDDLRDAIGKLEAHGITPFANAYKEWWVWKHIFQHYVNAAALQAGLTPKELVQMFTAGQAHIKDYPILYNHYFEFIDMTIEHGVEQPLKQGNMEQIKDFAQGQVAFMTGKGAWDEQVIKDIAPDIQLGIIGYPVNERPGHARIVTGADQALRINKDSPVADEAIDFFNWLYTSEYGKTWFSEVAQVIPPIQNATLPDLDIPRQMSSILQTELSGDLSVIHSTDTFHRKFGEVMQMYIDGALSKDEAVIEIEKAWVTYGTVDSL